MTTPDDIVAMTCLTRDEIAAIAEHEHLSLRAAALRGNYEMHLRDGAARVHQMIAEDIRAALHRGDLDHARALYGTLRHFLATHPQGARGVPG